MRKLIITGLFSILISLQINGQWSVGAVILSHFVVKDLLKRAEGTAQTLMNNAEISGNAFLMRSANQINVSLKNAQLIFHKEMDYAFDRLNTEKKTMLFELEKFRQSVENLQSTAFEFKDATFLDIQTSLGNVFPWAKQDFVIQRIDGITQLKKATGYRIKLMGIGFGTPSNHFQSRIKKVSINNTDITGFSENQVHSHLSELTITGNEINSLLNAKTPLFAKLKIVNEVKRKKGFLFFKRWVTNDYDFEFTATIYPLHAGEVKITYHTPKFSWKTVSKDVMYSYRTPNHHQTSNNPIKFPWSDYKVLPDNQRYTNLKYLSRDGYGCSWTEFHNIYTEENGKVLRIDGATEGQPCNYHYSADIEELKPDGEDKIVNVQDLTFGRSLIIDVPLETKYWEIEGKTITLNEFLIIGKSRFSDFLEFEDIIETGGTKKIIYRVNFSKDLY